MKSPKTELGAGGSGWVGGPCHRVLWPPGPVGEGLGRDAEAQGSRRAGAAPAPQSRARSLPDGFTKPVGPAGPREGGSGRESQSRGRGRRSLPPPHSSSRMNPGQLLSGLGMPEGDAPAWVWGRRFHFSPHPPSWPAARCPCPVPPSRPRHSPYILPSSERMIFRRPQGG